MQQTYPPMQQMYPPMQKNNPPFFDPSMWTPWPPQQQQPYQSQWNQNWRGKQTYLPKSITSTPTTTLLTSRYSSKQPNNETPATCTT